MVAAAKGWDMSGRRMTPARQVVPAGTLLWRVHDDSEHADQFTVGDHGRFTDDQGRYPCIYLSDRSTTALAERLLPLVNMSTVSGRRMLLRRHLNDKVLSAVRTTTELILLRLLDMQDLAAVGQQDDRMLTARPESYQEVRAWSSWLHDQLPNVGGIVWPSTYDLPQHTIMLFGDRCPQGALRAEPNSAIRLDDAVGANHLNQELAAYGVQVRRPAPVFINYRSSDDKLAVDLLDKELCGRLGERAVFRDDRSLLAGVEFAPELLTNVRRAKVLLAMIGERWEDTLDRDGRRRLDNESDWVRREIAEALANRVHVVPVLVGARRKLEEATLPEDIRAIAGRQFLHLRHGYTADDVRVLVDELFRDVPGIGDSHSRDGRT